MTRHIADQPRNGKEGTRSREYARIEREQGAGGPHATTAELQRRPSHGTAESRRMSEFLRHDRAGRS